MKVEHEYELEDGCEPCALTNFEPGLGLGVAEREPNGYRDAMKFRVLIAPDEDGVFVAECPVLPGCVSQGKTRDEAVANIRDAIQGYLHSLEKHNEPIPGPVAEEIVEVPV